MRTILLSWLWMLFLSSSSSYQFAVVPKRTNSLFFDAVREGCQARAQQYTDENDKNVTCLYVGPNENFNVTEVQIEILTNLLPSIDGFAIAVKNETAIATLIEKARAMKKHVVTFDSDAASSKRNAYVGTDNYKFGRELAHVLLQLSPDGGKYGIITGSTTSIKSPNIQLREDGVRDGLRRSNWIEVHNSPGDGQGNTTLALEMMESLVEANPDIGAIVPVGGWPMFSEQGWKAFVRRHPQIVTVVADAIDVQIQLMNQGAANGLVGQLPFQMGELAIDTLYQLATHQEQGLPPPFEDGTIFATSVLNVLQIPQNIPPLQEEMNYIGSLAIVGYVFVGIIAVFSVGFAVWTLIHRKDYVVRASQPPFLYMICFGVLIMGSAIIPMSIDDERASLEACSKACMSIPWLVSMGFVMTFSALFCKTWRVNQVFQNAARFRRVQVTAKDVIVPFAVLMTLNVIVLLCWTLIAPLRYERRASSGTDNWNRVSRSYYGACYGPPRNEVKGGSIPYAVSLLAINFSVLVIANIQAYRARKIKTDFSESKYVALIMLAMLQSWIIGLPILSLVRENPEASFLVASVLIFATCMATLLFLFFPKLTRKAEREASSARGSSMTTRPNTSILASSPRASRVVDDTPTEAFQSYRKELSALSTQNGETDASVARSGETRSDAASDEQVSNGTAQAVTSVDQPSSPKELSTSADNEATCTSTSQPAESKDARWAASDTAPEEADSTMQT